MPQLRTVKWEEVSQHNNVDGDAWVVLEDLVYDISDFVTRHPGGKIIQISLGRQVDTLVDSYHTKSARQTVDAVLKKSPVIGRIEGPEYPDARMLSPDIVVPDGVDVKSPEFWNTLQQRVEDELARNGFDRTGYQTWGVVEPLISMVLFYAAVIYRSYYGSWTAAVVSGMLMSRMGFLMHMGLHQATSHSPRANKLVGALMDMAGGSSFIWSHDHQVAHHVHPNIYTADNDCEIGAPMLRFHPSIKRLPKHKNQHWIAMIGMTFGFWKWIIADITDLMAKNVGVLKHLDVKPADLLAGLAWKASFLFLHVFMPVYLHGFWKGMGLAVVAMGIGAQYLEETFIVNHIQEGLIPPEGSHWAIANVLGSANWRSGSKFWNWTSGGLNHQIEHHLFPSTSHNLYPIISPVVQKTCAEFGLPYNNFPTYSDAHLGMRTYLKNLGLYDSPDQFPKDSYTLPVVAALKQKARAKKST